MLLVTAKERRFPLAVGDGIGDILVLFITKTSEDPETVVNSDGLDATRLSLEVPEKVIVGVTDEAPVWTILALFDGKIDPSRDCVVTGLLSLEITCETVLAVLAELTL